MGGLVRVFCASAACAEALEAPTLAQHDCTAASNGQDALLVHVPCAAGALSTFMGVLPWTWADWARKEAIVCSWRDAASIHKSLSAHTRSWDPTISVTMSFISRYFFSSVVRLSRSMACALRSAAKSAM